MFPFVLSQNAKEKFQQLQNVMAILGDPEKRELYDQTGSIDAADIDGDAVKSLYKFLRTLFKQVIRAEVSVSRDCLCFVVFKSLFLVFLLFFR